MDTSLVAIVAIICWCVISVVGSREDRYDHEGSSFKFKKDRSNRFYEEQIDELQARIAALEKIVTDEGYQLRKEFSQLKRQAVAG